MKRWRGISWAKAPILYMFVGVCAGVAASGGPALATSLSQGASMVSLTQGEDLAVVSLHAGVTHAATGATVTFTEVIRNNGTVPVEMDTIPQITGGTLVNAICDQGISADTPACEYDTVAPGTNLTTKFVIRVTAHSGGQLTVKGGVISEEMTQDNNPFNQYLTSSIPIT